MTFWLISLQQALPTLPTPEPISEGWELVETCGIPLYPPSPEKTSEARRILDRVSEQLQEEEESKASLREWLMDDQNSSAESAVDYGLYSELNAPPPPHRDSRSGPSTDENAAPRGDSKSELKQVTNQEDDSVEYNIVSLDFYEEEHDERYKYSKVCQRAVKHPLNTTPLTIRNTSIKKFWRVHIRHCGGVTAGHLVCRTYHDVPRNYPIQILFRLHQEGGGAPKVSRSCLRSAGYYREDEQGGLIWVAERGEEVRVNANDQRKVRDSPWKSLNEELWLELLWSELEPPSRN